MNNKPLVSVIVPVYNNQEFIHDCLDSILSQTYKNIEIIAIDDGSSDSSLDILKSYGNKIKILSQTNSGASSARNTGISVSSGEILAFLDSDDIWDKNKLDRSVTTLQNHPNAVGVYHDVRYIDASGTIIKPTDAYRMAWCSGQILAPLITGKGVFGFSPSSTIIRKKYCTLVNGFNEQIKQCEDYALWLNLSLHGPFLYLVDTLSSYRRHPGSLTTSKDVHYEQLHGQYLALLSIKGALKTYDPSILAIYKKELYECSRTLGYWARIKNNSHLSLEAYRLALTLKPLNLHVLSRTILCFVKVLFIKFQK